MQKRIISKKGALKSYKIFMKIDSFHWLTSHLQRFNKLSLLNFESKPTKMEIEKISCNLEARSG